MENKVIEHDFNAKLIQNLETENKYIKETVRIQTAQITFLKKQHLEVIESMITLNQKKVPEEGMLKAQKLNEIVKILDKQEKIYKQTKVINIMEILSQIDTVLENKYSFLKASTVLQEASPLKNIHPRNEDHLQQSNSYQ